MDHVLVSREPSDDALPQLISTISEPMRIAWLLQQSDVGSMARNGIRLVDVAQVLGFAVSGKIKAGCYRCSSSGPARAAARLLRGLCKWPHIGG